MAHLVDDPLIETEGHVCLKGHRHPLKEGFKTDTLVSFPNVIIVAAVKGAHTCTQNHLYSLFTCHVYLDTHLTTRPLNEDPRPWSFM